MMGVENNECILATTWCDEDIDKVRQWINGDALPLTVTRLSEREKQLFAFIPSLANGETTIVMGPDGSKKGWEGAKRGKLIRDLFVTFIDKLYFDWVEVGYGEFGQTVLRGNNTNCYSDDEYEHWKI